MTPARRANIEAVKSAKAKWKILIQNKSKLEALQSETLKALTKHVPKMNAYVIVVNH
jgi:hypothetical protein